MGPGIFIIAIMGCGEGNAACQPLHLLDERYRSRAECVAASEAALIGQGDVDYPSVVAQCVTAKQAASLRLMPGEVRLPAAPPARGLAPSRIASRR